MNKKFSLVSLFLLFPLVAIANTHKSETYNINSRSNDINIKSGSNNIQLYDDGMVDQGTKDIISSEYNFQGNLINCTIGKSSKRRDLPSCNQVIEKRTKEEERMRRVEEKRFEKQRQEKERYNKLFAKKKSTTKSFTFPDGLKINTVTQIRFNPETSEIIVNSEVLKQSGNREEFMKIFIEGNSKLEIAFFDKEKFELVDPMIFPLNIYEGQNEGFKYRKKVGKDTSDFKGIKMLGRARIEGLSEFKKISSIGVALKI